MKSALELNKKIEEETGVYDPLCIQKRWSMPFFGARYIKGLRNRLEALLKIERVGLDNLDLERAIDFLMPSTTDFSRSWVGERVAELINKQDPRVVTFGCSTGLEVYWIVYFLLKKGLLSDDIKVTGVDINMSALEVAKAGKYHKADYDRCFPDDRRFGNEKALNIDEASETVSFKDEIKAHANFEKANILDFKSLADLGLDHMDVVVAMNVLKYMNSAAIQQVLSNVKEIVSDGSFLITDPNTFEIVKEHPNFECIDNRETVLQCVK